MEGLNYNKVVTVLDGDQLTYRLNAALYPADRAVRVVGQSVSGKKEEGGGGDAALTKKDERRGSQLVRYLFSSSRP